MRKLESKEIKGIMYRTWYLQEFDLKTMQELNLELPDSIKMDIEMNLTGDENKFFSYSSPIDYDFIKSQHFFVDELDVANFNLYEIKIALKQVQRELSHLKQKTNKIYTKEEMENIKVELILNKNKYKSFMYLKEQKEKSLRNKRK